MPLSDDQKETLKEVWLRAIDNHPDADKAWEGAFRTYEDGNIGPLTPRMAWEAAVHSGRAAELVEDWLDKNPEETFENVCEALTQTNGAKLKI